MAKTKKTTVLGEVGKKIKPLALIVEDNALLSNLFSRALHDIDYETMIISNGKKAMKWLMKREPDLLFLDLHLPEVSGEEIINTITDDRRFDGTYIVIITADARMGGALQKKADFLLNKPVDIFQLQRLAERLRFSRRVRK